MSLVYKEVFEDGYPVECEWAMDADSADLHKMRDQLRAHAAALEELARLKADTLTAVQAAHDESYQMRKEIERLNGERDELKELLIEKTRVERGYLDAFVKAERRAERLKVHAEAMAARIEWYAEEGWVNGDIPEARAYRAEFKDGEK